MISSAQVASAVSIPDCTGLASSERLPDLPPAPSQTEWITTILTPDYLAVLAQQLQNCPSLLELVAVHLFRHLTAVYQVKVESVIAASGLEAIDTSLSHFKLSRQQGRPVLDYRFDRDRSVAHLQQSLVAFCDQASVWQGWARAIGLHLIVQVLATIETRVGTPQFEALSAEVLATQIAAQLAELSEVALQERLRFLSHISSPELAQQILAGFDLPNCTLLELERLLGLRQRSVSSTHTSLKLDPITVVPTAIPIASSIRAQLRPDLWQQDANNQAVFHYRSKSNPSNYIEHYITNPGDIALLPWEAAEQIINKFGFDTVKLQLIFAARTMQEQEPWNSAFTLRATDIIQLLGWDRNHSTSLPEKRNAVATTAYALSCLLVKSVWIEGRGHRKVDASTPIGRMWDVLIDPHGQIDWVTGKIERPDEVYITISPGLWTKHFLNRAGSKAKEALHQFGYLAQDILRIDPYHNELALRLAIQLTLDARVRVRNHHPYDYRVLSLLEESLPAIEIEKALQDKHRARDLKNRWNSALKLLMRLGWQLEFDPATYPDWLQPNTQAAKPEDWRKMKVIERLFQAKLTIKPPHPIPTLLARIAEPKKVSPKALPAPEEICGELTGDQIKAGRLQIGWSRKELGGFLDLSADYIGKLERGDRLVTPELDAKLRKLLHL